MSPVIFLGPTLPIPAAERHLKATYLPPAAQGDVLRLLPRRPSVIGIIDGSFQFAPAVWHKEILAAMEAGIHVYGGASMGALRAAELAPFGMIGVGKIFEQYRAGVHEDDDEVAVLFASEGQDYCALSEAAIDIRDICGAALKRKVIDQRAEAVIVAITKQLYFPDRRWDRIEQEALSAGVTGTTLTALAKFRKAYGPTLKQRDAITLLKEIGAFERKKRQPMRVDYRLERTIFFTRLQHELAREVNRDLETSPGGPLDVARKKVLLGMLASKEAMRTGMLPSEEEITTMTEWFRETYSLAGDEELATWLKESNLPRESFELGMRRFASVVKIEEVSRVDLLRETDDYLRLYGAASSHSQDQPQWTQIAIKLRRDQGDPQSKAVFVFRTLVEAMPVLKKKGRLIDFHFVRKQPDIRLRLQTRGTPRDLEAVLEPLLEDLKRRRYIDAFSVTIYEPEWRQFGGLRATAAVHEYFHSDSLNWIRLHCLTTRRPNTRPEDIVCAVLNDLFFRTLGCVSEVWDTWHNLLTLTKASIYQADAYLCEAPLLADLLSRMTPEERGILRRYEKANSKLAGTLLHLRNSGQMSAPLRSVLPFVAMFHCNRFGIDGSAQASIAKAMTEVWDSKRGFR